MQISGTTFRLMLLLPETITSWFIQGGTALQSLMAGDTVAGLAGGVNAQMLPITTCTICGLSALSGEARCKTFDASADGYGRGEAFAGASHQSCQILERSLQYNGQNWRQNCAFCPMTH